MRKQLITITVGCMLAAAAGTIARAQSPGVRFKDGLKIYMSDDRCV